MLFRVEPSVIVISAFTLTVLLGVRSPVTVVVTVMGSAARALPANPAIRIPANSASMTFRHGVRFFIRFLLIGSLPASLRSRRSGDSSTSHAIRVAPVTCDRVERFGVRRLAAALQKKVRGRSGRGLEESKEPD